MIIDVYGQGEKFYCIYDDNSYKPVINPKEWLACPNCGLKPLVWEFNNGSYTACGCGKDPYNNFTVRAESIASYINRAHLYKSDKCKSWYDEYTEELKNNWNAYCETGDNQAFEKKKRKILEEQNIDIW